MPHCTEHSVRSTVYDVQFVCPYVRINIYLICKDKHTYIKNYHYVQLVFIIFITFPNAGAFVYSVVFAINTALPPIVIRNARCSGTTEGTSSFWIATDPPSRPSCTFTRAAVDSDDPSRYPRRSSLTNWSFIKSPKIPSWTINSERVSQWGYIYIIVYILTFVRVGYVCRYRSM